MDGVTVIDHPLVQHKLTIMRRKETSTGSFRRLLREISTLLCYEVTRDLELTMETIETPLQTMESPILEGKKLVFASILRAGNGLRRPGASAHALCDRDQGNRRFDRRGAALVGRDSMRVGERVALQQTRSPIIRHAVCRGVHALLVTNAQPGTDIVLPGDCGCVFVSLQFIPNGGKLRKHPGGVLAYGNPGHRPGLSHLARRHRS